MREPRDSYWKTEPILTPSLLRRALDLLSDQHYGEKGQRELAAKDVLRAVKATRGEKH